MFPIYDKSNGTFTGEYLKCDRCKSGFLSQKSIKDHVRNNYGTEMISVTERCEPEISFDY